jgi:hypothetical protein
MFSVLMIVHFLVIMIMKYIFVEDTHLKVTIFNIYRISSTKI